MTSSQRRPLVAGNWKMHTTVPAALELASQVLERLPREPPAQVVLLPPMVSVWAVRQLVGQDPRVQVGAQDCYWEPEGAFTGQVSAAMLQGACTYVLVGHSERRHLFGDSDRVVRQKLDAVLAAGLRPLLAVGETALERTSGRTHEVLETQLCSALGGLSEEGLMSCVVAYEPVWAIGAGETASPDDVEDATRELRQALDAIRAGAGQQLLVLYGGSVAADSAPDILAIPDVDGALVGGASLEAADFCAIVRAAGAGPA